MESQHQDQNGQQTQHQHQQHQHQDQHHLQLQLHQNQNHIRGSKRGPGRPRGSSRAGRPSSSSGIHHSYNDSPASFTNVINFAESPASIHARTPASRGRGRDIITSQSHSYSHSQTPPASVVESSPPSSETPIMDLNADESPASRSERALKHHSLQHSFTFSTPQNPRNPPGRKRARTLEYPTDSNSAAEDAKVKGGHSLRKRARIDYAQMNEHEDDDPNLTHATPTEEEPMEITVSGVRSVRKRRSTADPSYEDEELVQPATVPPQKRRARTVEKQRTASPPPLRRPYQKRKSAVAANITLELPEQQPSDTELKDSIEVGAPLALQFPSSSSQTQSSETASNISGQSPSRNANKQQQILSQPEVASPEPIQPKNEPDLDPIEEIKFSPSIQDNNPPHPHNSITAPLSPAAITESIQPTLNGNSEHNNSIEKQSTEIIQPPAERKSKSPAPIMDVAEVSKVDQPEDQTQTTQTFQPDNLTITQPENLQSAHPPPPPPPPPASQETMNSDTTEIVPPTEPTPITAPSEPEQPIGEENKIPDKVKGKQTAAESRQEEMEEIQQETPKLGLRPRRQRLSRLAENSIAADEETSPSQLSKEKPTPPGRKSDDRFKSANRSAIDDNGPSSPETPRKRGPGRPPKNRALNEQEPVKPAALKPKERRASRTSSRLEHPRPVRPHPPRDFSFLTPYLDARDIYPENIQESGMPTPLETPTLQPSDAAADEQTEETGSLAPEKDSGSQSLQQDLDGDAGSNAPTPAAMYDAPTPASVPDSAAPSRNVSPEPIIEPMRKPKPRRQYSFARIRSPTNFINILDDHKNLTDEDLNNILAISANALEAWQDEWKEQRLITEDEDNAVRRRAHDAAFAAREARDLAKSTGSVTLEKRDFEIKGIRVDRLQESKAKYPLGNPEAYERNQDMIAAQAWGFEWDPRASMIGKQDPIAQREGLQNTRLRNRPKLSQRAAEAAGDEPVGIVPGKRTRKPRLLSDESKEPSRAPTPVPEPVKPKRRRRRNVEAELADSDNETSSQQPEEVKPEIAPPPPAPPAKKPYTGKKRGPKPKAEREALARAAAEREAAEKAAQEEAAAEAEAAAAAEAEAEAEATATTQQNETEIEPPKTRKRRRGAAGAEIQPQDIPTASIEDIQPDGPAQRQPAQEEDLPVSKRQRGRKPKVEIPTTNFYSTTSSAPTNEDVLTPTEEKRPSTSSSTSSMRTVGSSYSFRTRPRKNYSELADPVKDVLTEGRPKRGRKPKTHHDEPEPTSYPANLAPAPFSGGPQYPMAAQGYHVQPPPVLAHPSNNPFLPITGSHPGPLLAPSSLRPGHIAAPPSVGANPFSAPMNAPVEAPQHPQSPRRKPIRIKIINRRGQTATPQPDGPPPVMPPQHSFPSMHHTASLAPLQPPSSFHGHNGGYDPHMYGGLPPPSIPGSGPGQVMFPVNASPGGAMSMPPMLQNAPPLPPLGSLQGPGSVTGSRANSKPPGSGRATPAPSSAASSTGAGGPAGDEALSEKDYASMTKSEKMSASMKARWANGSMRQAVNKRKETLARKKQSQADKSVPGASVTPTPQPEPNPAASAQAQAQAQNGSATPLLPPPASSGLSETTGPVSIPPSQRQHSQTSHAFGGGLHLVGSHDSHSTGGVVLPPPSAMTAGPLQQVDGPTYAPARREPARQNPFLDNGYADRRPRLPFLPNGTMEDLMDGRYDHGHGGSGWGPGPQQH